MRFDKLAARGNLLAHKHGKSPVGLRRVGQVHLLQHTVLRIHRRFPELLRIHLSKTFVTLEHQTVRVAAAAVVDKTLHLLLVPRIFLYLGLPLRGALVERRGGYCPAGITFEERTRLLHADPARFRELVDETLRRHYKAISRLVENGTYFFDYGNSFMKAIYDAGVKEISKNGIDEKDGFIWPSYVEDIMGPMLFDYGYGPFRWVCLSGKHEDLVKTDHAAMECIDPNRRGQDRDNYNWIRDAEKNALVVGTQARILYQDAMGRLNIALKFNDMVRKGEVGPIMLGRDHHDVSGTDSPFRETSNIKDGSNVMADMAVQCFAGNCARGMSLVALHNGGGVGIGKAINGGFGMVCDGSDRVDAILKQAMLWDVMGGVARRSWARNENAMSTVKEWNDTQRENGFCITEPFLADEEYLKSLI